MARYLQAAASVGGCRRIIGLILNYLRREQYGPPLDSHHRWMIRY